jgi:hypothetical protein
MPLLPRAYRAGESLEDDCRACKTDRMHTVVAADADGRPIRVACGFCRSEHNYRGGPRLQPSSVGGRSPDEPERRPAGPAPSGASAPRSRSTAEPFPAVSDRERTAPRMTPDSTTDFELLLRRIIREETGLTLEQHVNAAELPDDVKVKLQGYITGCYGSLTSFNVLFADEDDQFKGSAAD